MSVLVGYTSTHGSTREIAERIGTRLREQGCQVDVRSMDRVEDVGAYDAVVLGSAIHNRTWMPEAAEFLRRNRGPLARRPVWLFGVGMLGDRGSALTPPVTALIRRLWKEPTLIRQFRPVLDLRDYHTFVGVVRPEHFSCAGRLIFKAMGARYGDQRDWSEIDCWAKDMARQIRSTEEARSAVPV